MSNESAFEQVVRNLKQARMRLPLVKKPENSKRFTEVCIQPLGDLISEHKQKGLACEKLHRAKTILDSSVGHLNEAIRLSGESSELTRDYLVLIGAGGAFGYGTVFDIKRHGVGAVPSALTPEQKVTVDLYLNALKHIYSEDFIHLEKDPDKSGAVNEASKEEAAIGLALRECGKIPEDIQRPSSRGRGEFYSPSTGKYYDIKGLHSDWPPLSNQRDKNKPFPGSYTYSERNKQTFIDNLEDQIVGKNREVIVDIRNADKNAIKDLSEVVSQKRWNSRVIWFP